MRVHVWMNVNYENECASYTTHIESIIKRVIFLNINVHKLNYKANRKHGNPNHNSEQQPHFLDLH